MTTLNGQTELGCEESEFSCGAMRLFSRCWRPDGEVRFVVALIPGFADHSNRYPHLISYALKQQVAVMGLDTRGHGRSSGPRGHVDSFDDYLLDVDSFLEHVRRQFAQSPLVLWGHSMGALIALRYLSSGRAADQQLRAALICAPALRLAVRVPMWKAVAANVLSRLVPWFTLPSELDVDSLSRDLEVGRRYMEDPLVHGVISSRLYTEMVRVGAHLLANPVNYNVPSMFVHGLGDTIIDPTGTTSYVERLPLTDALLKLYPEARHELHNDPIHGTLFADAFEFLSARTLEPVAG